MPIFLVNFCKNLLHVPGSLLVVVIEMIVKRRKQIEKS